MNGRIGTTNTPISYLSIISFWFYMGQDEHPKNCPPIHLNPTCPSYPFVPFGIMVDTLSKYFPIGPTNTTQSYSEMCQLHMELLEEGAIRIPIKEPELMRTWSHGIQK